jgi:hypothetical protein
MRSTPQSQRHITWARSDATSTVQRPNLPPTSIGWMRFARPSARIRSTLAQPQDREVPLRSVARATVRTVPQSQRQGTFLVIGSNDPVTVHLSNRWGDSEIMKLILSDTYSDQVHQQIALMAAPNFTLTRRNFDTGMMGRASGIHWYTYWLVGAICCPSSNRVAVIVPSALAV